MKDKKNRRLKVYAQSNGYNYQDVPTIVLKGKWLEEAGFEIGDNFVLEVVDEGLILRKTAADGDASCRALQTGSSDSNSALM